MEPLGPDETLRGVDRDVDWVQAAGGGAAAVSLPSRSHLSAPRRVVTTRPDQTASESFVGFYREHYPQTVRLASLLTGSSEIGEDLTQEAFVVLVGRYDTVAAPRAYLRATVVNMAHSHHRRRAKGEERLRLLANPEPRAPGFETVEVADLIAALPFRQRVVIVGRYWAGWSEAELAEALGCRPGTVKSLASRAMDSLRAQLGRSDR